MHAFRFRSRQPRRGHAGAGGLLACALLLGTGTASGASGEAKSSWVVIPFPIYSPETEWAGTLTAMWHRRPSEDAQPSSLMLSSAYSQMQQFSINLSPDIGLLDNRLWLSGDAGFQEWPDLFYGIGHDTRREAEEDYTGRTSSVGISLRYRVASYWSAGIRGEWTESRIRETEPGGLLDIADIPGIPAATIAGLGLVITWDSRDDRFAPSGGTRFDLSAMAYREKRSAARFQRARADARQFLGLGAWGVLALHEYVSLSFGDVPFQQLSRIGDIRDVSLMRGIYSGRYLDRNAALAQAEWRFPLVDRLSGVAFAGSGVIGDTLWDSGDSSLYWAGGGGIRYRVSRDERVHVRLDVAAGREKVGVYFAFLEAF